MHYTVYIFSINKSIMKDITSQQNKVLDCIQVYHKENRLSANKSRYMPRIRVLNHQIQQKPILELLEKKGFIAIESGTSRGISIINPEIDHEGR